MKRSPFAFLLTLALLTPATALAAPYWGEFEADHCTAIGKRQYSAILWGIPWWQSWENACWSTGAWIHGQYFPHPTRCVNTVFNMWGEFDVTDSSCPHWGEFSTRCYDEGIKHYAAILWDIPWGYSWEDACESTPATLAGQYFPHPDWCENDGFHEWGHFYVPEHCPCHTYTQRWMCSGMCVTTQSSTCERRDPDPGGNCRLANFGECT